MNYSPFSIPWDCLTRPMGDYGSCHKRWCGLHLLWRAQTFNSHWVPQWFLHWSCEDGVPLKGDYMVDVIFRGGGLSNWRAKMMLFMSPGMIQDIQRSRWFSSWQLCMESYVMYQYLEGKIWACGAACQRCCHRGNRNVSHGAKTLTMAVPIHYMRQIGFPLLIWDN